MPRFEITFEDRGLTDNRSVCTAELTMDEAIGYNTTATAEGTFPPNVLGVVGGHVSEDDAQGNEDIRVFSVVTLLVEANDEAAAAAFPVPDHLLSALTDMMTTPTGGSLHLEGSWAVSDLEAAEELAPAPGQPGTSYFDVTFEDTALTNDRSVCQAEITFDEALGFTEVSIKEGTFPPNVVAVVGGQVSEDMGQGSSDIRVFSNVTLRVSAPTEAAAANFAPPEDLLTRLTDMMIAPTGSSLHLEGGWSVLCCTEAPGLSQDSQDAPSKGPRP